MDSQANVMPAKAGIQAATLQASAHSSWMPACAGMTGTYPSNLN
jgi:hypothetical protein